MRERGMLMCCVPYHHQDGWWWFCLKAVQYWVHIFICSPWFYPQGEA